MNTDTVFTVSCATHRGPLDGAPSLKEVEEGEGWQLDLSGVSCPEADAHTETVTETDDEGNETTREVDVPATCVIVVGASVTS